MVTPTGAGYAPVNGLDTMDRTLFEVLQHSPMYAAYQQIAPDVDASLRSSTKPANSTAGLSTGPTTCAASRCRPCSCSPT
jgi:hypothetical protein